MNMKKNIPPCPPCYRLTSPSSKLLCHTTGSSVKDESDAIKSTKHCWGTHLSTPQSVSHHLALTGRVVCNFNHRQISAVPWSRDSSTNDREVMESSTNLNRTGCNEHGDTQSICHWDMKRQEKTSLMPTHATQKTRQHKKLSLMLTHATQKTRQDIVTDANSCNT